MLLLSFSFLPVVGYTIISPKVTENVIGFILISKYRMDTFSTERIPQFTSSDTRLDNIITLVFVRYCMRESKLFF